jgi:predicted transcriptional regulator
VASVARVPDPPPPVEGLEAEVLEEVWSRGSATVRDVMTAINARSRRERAYTTFMTTMVRLHGKGLLERRRAGKIYHYTPAISRERYAASRAQADVRALMEQHGELALSEFARRVAELDPERRAALERLGRDD